MLDLHATEHGYTEIAPPLLVRDDVMFGTTQIPKFVDDQFLATRTITRTELLHDALKHANPADAEQFKRGEIDLAALVDRIIERAALREDFWRIPTAEVPLTNRVRVQLVEGAALRLGVTPC